MSELPARGEQPRAEPVRGHEHEQPSEAEQEPSGFPRPSRLALEGQEPKLTRRRLDGGTYRAQPLHLGAEQLA
jgi:hypothetical protein